MSSEDDGANGRDDEEDEDEDLEEDTDDESEAHVSAEIADERCYRLLLSKRLAEGTWSLAP